MAQGYGGELYSHESEPFHMPLFSLVHMLITMIVYLFVLDAAPLIVGIAIYAIFWPGKYCESAYGLPSNHYAMEDSSEKSLHRPSQST